MSNDKGLLTRSLAVVVRMWRCRSFRDEVQVPETDAALARHPVCQLSELTCGTSKDGYFEASVVVEMNMEGRHRHVVMLVLGVREPAGEVAHLVVVDVA